MINMNQEEGKEKFQENRDAAVLQDRMERRDLIFNN